MALNSFGLSANILQSICSAIGNFPEVERAQLFGSRARGNFKPESDIDIAVIAPTMSAARFAMLWSALDELPLVFKLDLLHFEALSNDALRNKILRDGIQIHPQK